MIGFFLPQPLVMLIGWIGFGLFVIDSLVVVYLLWRFARPRRRQVDGNLREEIRNENLGKILASIYKKEV